MADVGKSATLFKYRQSLSLCQRKAIRTSVDGIYDQQVDYGVSPTRTLG